MTLRRDWQPATCFAPLPFGASASEFSSCMMAAPTIYSRPFVRTLHPAAIVMTRTKCRATDRQKPTASSSVSMPCLPQTSKPSWISFDLFDRAKGLSSVADKGSRDFARRLYIDIEMIRIHREFVFLQRSLHRLPLGGRVNSLPVVFRQYVKIQRQAS